MATAQNWTDDVKATPFFWRPMSILVEISVCISTGAIRHQACASVTRRTNTQNRIHTPKARIVICCYVFMLPSNVPARAAARPGYPPRASIGEGSMAPCHVGGQWGKESSKLRRSLGKKTQSPRQAILRLLVAALSGRCRQS